VYDPSKKRERMRLVNCPGYSSIVNCQGPREIRAPGRLFKLKNTSIEVVTTKYTFFYKLSNNPDDYEVVAEGIQHQARI
jgi:hypothetical protein